MTSFISFQESWDLIDGHPSPSMIKPEELHHMQEIKLAIFKNKYTTWLNGASNPNVPSRMSKRWYIYKGTLFDLKKEGNSDTCCNVVEPLYTVTKGTISYDST